MSNASCTPQDPKEIARRIVLDIDGTTFQEWRDDAEQKIAAALENYESDRVVRLTKIATEAERQRDHEREMKFLAVKLKLQAQNDLDAAREREKALVEALAKFVALDDGDEPFAWKHSALFDEARAALAYRAVPEEGK